MIEQAIANGIVAASLYFLIGCGIDLIYATSRFFHLGHGVIYAAGAYAGFMTYSIVAVSIPLAIAVAIAFGVLLGLALELGIYRPLRHKGAPSFVLLMASLAVYVVLQNLLSLTFGDSAKSIVIGSVEEGFPILGARLTGIQGLILCLGAALYIGLVLFLKYARLGLTIRALACERELARISGIENDRLILWSFLIGSGIAALGGILSSIDTSLSPSMGMTPMLMGTMACLIGGLGKLRGLFPAALFIGLVQHIGALYLGSQWQDMIAFAILFGFLLLKPRGLISRSQIKAAI